MKLNKIKTLGTKLFGFGKDKSPEILAALALAGVIKTAVDSFKAGPEAKKIIRQAKDKLDLAESKEEEREIKIVAAKQLARRMTPVVLDVALTGAAIVGSNRISNKRIVLLSAAYKMSETSLDSMNKKVREVLGDKKANDIRQSIAKEKFKEENEKHKDDTIIMTGDGHVICMDLYSEQKFYSNAQKIGAVINKLSARCLIERYITLNELYSELGIRSKRFGEEFGWNIDDIIEGQLPIYIGAELDENNQPVLTIDYTPKMIDYNRY